MENYKKGQDWDIRGKNIFQRSADRNGTKGNQTLTFLKSNSEYFQWLERKS